MIAAANMPMQITTMGQFSTLIKGFSNMGEISFKEVRLSSLTVRRESLTYVFGTHANAK
jgi:hypothetical protein